MLNGVLRSFYSLHQEWDISNAWRKRGITGWKKKLQEHKCQDFVMSAAPLAFIVLYPGPGSLSVGGKDVCSVEICVPYFVASSSSFPRQFWDETAICGCFPIGMRRATFCDVQQNLLFGGRSL